MQHLSIAVSPPVFHIFSRFLGGAESPNVELSQYVIFIFLTVLVGQRFLLYHENSCRGRRRGCATNFFWSAGFLFPNQSSCPISGRSVQPLWSAQKAVRLWGSITVLIIIGLACNGVVPLPILDVSKALSSKPVRVRLGLGLGYIYTRSIHVECIGT